MLRTPSDERNALLKTCSHLHLGPFRAIFSMTNLHFCLILWALFMLLAFACTGLSSCVQTSTLHHHVRRFARRFPILAPRTFVFFFHFFPVAQAHTSAIGPHTGLCKPERTPPGCRPPRDVHRWTDWGARNPFFVWRKKGMRNHQ